MALVLTVLVALVAALGGRWLGIALRAEPESAAGVPTAELEELRAAVARAQERVDELAGEAKRGDGALLPAVVEEDGFTDEELAQALARWRAAHPEAEAELAEARARVPAPATDELDLATMPIAGVVRELARAGFDDEERQVIFEKLRALGRIDEYVAEIERLAAADPENVELQVALGHAYLQKLFGMGASPEVGAIAWKSDQAFDRALQLDESSWSARFSKAVALSNWPAFLGRGSEAMEHFEILIDQQEQQTPQAHFAYPYLFLGNMYQASGERPKAIATWKEGLALFPEDPGLLAAMKAAGL
jgi:tetratricopeptide (TPR) repeat protein